VKNVSSRSVTFNLTLRYQTFFQSANYVRTELPVRISHRIRDIQALPYAVVMQDGVAKVYKVGFTISRSTDSAVSLFLGSCIGPRLRSMFNFNQRRNVTLTTPCSRFVRFPRIETLEDNERFCSFLRGLLDEQYAYMLNPLIISHAFVAPLSFRIYPLASR